MKNPRRLALAVLAALAAVVVLQNMDQTPVRFFFFERSMPLALLLLCVLVLGAGIGYLLGWKKPPRRDATKDTGKYQ